FRRSGTFFRKTRVYFPRPGDAIDDDTDRRPQRPMLVILEMIERLADLSDDHLVTARIRCFVTVTIPFGFVTLRRRLPVAGRFRNADKTGNLLAFKAPLQNRVVSILLIKRENVLLF